MWAMTTDHDGSQSFSFEARLKMRTGSQCSNWHSPLFSVLSGGLLDSSRPTFSGGTAPVPNASGQDQTYHFSGNISFRFTLNGFPGFDTWPAASLATTNK